MKFINRFTGALVASFFFIGTSSYAEVRSLICDGSFSERRIPWNFVDHYPIMHVPNVLLIRFDGNYYRLSAIYVDEVMDYEIKRMPGSDERNYRVTPDYYSKSFVTLTHYAVNDDTIEWSDSAYGKYTLNRRSLRVTGVERDGGRSFSRECSIIPAETYDIAFGAFETMVDEYNEFVSSSISHQKRVLSILDSLGNGI